MFTAELLERAAKTFVQALLVTFFGLMGATLLHGVTFSLAWWEAAAAAALSGGLTAGVSAVTSLLSKPVGPAGTASIVPTVGSPVAK